MLQKKAPNDLKSLDAELKSAHALRGMPRVGRVPLRGYGPSLRFCKRTGRVPRPSVPKASTARRRPSSLSPRRTPRCAAEGWRGEADQPIAELSAARIAGARNVPFVGSGQSEWAARPEGNFSSLHKALKKHEAGKESRAPRGCRGRPSEHLRRAHPRGLLLACRSFCKPLPRARRGKASPIRRERCPFVPEARSRPSRCRYFFCDFT